MTGHLILRLEAALQSWGLHGRFDAKDTNREPTKSGIIGLLANAQGRQRHNPIDDLAQLQLTVRVDHEGRLQHDYRTAGGGNADELLRLHGLQSQPGYFPPSSSSKGPASNKRNPVLMAAHYLSDATFTVALSGDRTLLETCAEAVQSPLRILYLGRRSFTPTRPLFERLIDSDADTINVLAGFEWEPRPGQQPHHYPEKLRYVQECPLHQAEATIPDQPVSFGVRTHLLRGIRTSHRALTDTPIRTSAHQQRTGEPAHG